MLAHRSIHPRAKLREIGRQRLQTALDSLSNVSPGEAALPLDLALLLKMSFDDYTPRLSRDFHLRTQDRPPVRSVLLLHRHKELLWDLEAQDEGADLDDLRTKLVHRACFLAGVYIPVASAVGRYRLAIQAAFYFHQRIFRADHQRVLGAGSIDTGDPRYRFLTLSPVLQALGAYLPEEEPTHDDRVE